jgi:predicted esterase
MALLNPAIQPIDAPSARLILIHGRDDRIIPYTESQALAQRFCANAQLYIVDSLGHVEFTGSALGTIMDLWRANMALFSLRD